MSTKICFIALSAYPLLAGKKGTRVIGPDVHTTLLAKELIRHDFEVAFVTYNEGGPHVEYLDGIQVIKAYPLKGSLLLNPMFKTFEIWKAMKKAKANIYFHHSGAPAG